ncbi:MAG: macrocin O-methyltransferase [Coleofasciculaceae cyanobacterium SM2_1_6]|nr:macrocin O-methyltransferase [Coleofasciculaceae cyanobacterium SM2_1_6]
MFADTAIPKGDYVSPGFQVIRPDRCFPSMIIGDPRTQPWQYLRREIPHNWYVDGRQPYVGFLSRDEAHILYNNALKFAGKPALEIGCWLGWSACHLALAGVELDVIDPMLGREDFLNSVTSSLTMAGVIDRVNLIPGYSPAAVLDLVKTRQSSLSGAEGQWSLIFIDGNHEVPGPLEDAIACAQFAAPDAMILFHDLAAPAVAQGLDYLKSQGWQTMVYQTMQIMGVAWRGNVQPVSHQPDPSISWQLPVHLQHYDVSGLGNFDLEEFKELVNQVQPFTLLSEMRLYSLYTATKQICLGDLPGNFVECGAFKGGASAMMAAVIKRYTQRPRKLFAFDTFAGMPEPTEIDRAQGVAANDTGFGVGTLSAPVAENIGKITQELGVTDIVEIVPGLFADTLPVYREQIGEIALLHADGDWYESTMDIFNNLYDAVVPNGLVQIDDYGHWEGCRAAVHEFERSRNLQFVLEKIDYTGVRFINNPKLVAPPEPELPYEFREINILICPDWQQPETSLQRELSVAIASILAHPQREKIAIFVETQNIDTEDASLLVSGVFMDLLMETELAEEKEPAVNFLGNLNLQQWGSLLSQINYYLPLNPKSSTAKTIEAIKNMTVWQVLS